ncbi:Ger(x)C family spore germination protein [Paenibacillus sp. NPDC058071]|uniref:Ger(x)C family spore germination protein n=1 Tax=Paenibacillus sp. NPDC058071 TaxID=3346326 RepID=UPI0036D9F601
MWRITGILRIWACVALLLSSALLLSGCWDRREINDVAFVLGSGIDLTDDGKYLVSVLIPLPGNIGGAVSLGGGGGGQKPFTIKIEEGESIKEAIDIMQNSLPRTLFFGHRRILVIGEKLARTVGASPIIDAVTRLPENRLTAFVAVAKGSALDILNADVRLERFSVESLRELMQSEAIVRVSLKDITSKVDVIGTEAFLPYLIKKTTKIKGQEADDIDIAGFALTQGGMMKAVARNGEANGIRLLSGRFRPYRDSIKDENGNKVMLGINKAIVKVKPQLANGKLIYRIQTQMQISINEDMDTNRNYDDIGQRRAIEELFEQKAKSDITRSIALMQKYNCDVIAFGLYAYRAYPDKWEQDWRAKWGEMFPNCEFDVQVRANLFRIGMNRENLAKKE